MSCYTKQKLFKKFPFLVEKEAVVVLNEIIAEKRNLPLDKAKWKKNLRPNEIAEFCKVYDIAV